ncbi:LysR family transcriptional regulator [Mycolicibacterium sp. 018/SC-01/001]|uniref:LysR family transcriptional regulator n=1 Tax=Mycolicibacterium sp. 018/SC-01/001 TaxID=2592069 RepID=UPI00117FDACC|nr:LysR family transcriptional regulator [Mycolicibacterium sp. 018/SC-01/001]TRW89119.1 LysR family transcriptional regulator [Mycolicibacterium sp. 018/SC-01/001]
MIEGRMVELRALTYFVAVAEEESFTRAAARCHVAQPSISQQISLLERELGEPLFTRTSKGIVLSAGGETLLPYARQCLALLAEAKADFIGRNGLLKGRLTFGTVTGVEHTCVPDALGMYHSRYPGVEVVVTEGTSAPLLSMVGRGQLNAAVIAAPVDPLPDDIGADVVHDGELVAVFDPARFDLPEDSVPLSTVAEHPVICYTTTSGLRPLIDSAFEQQNLKPFISYAANDVRLQVAFARQGVGIAISASTDPALDDLGALVTRPLQPSIPFQKVLVWRDDLNPSAPLRAFLEVWHNVTAVAGVGSITTDGR